MAANDSLSNIVACRAEPGHQLWLRFGDGIEGRVYLGHLLDIGAFKLWRDPRQFSQVRPEGGAVVWVSGARLDGDILRWDFIAQRHGARGTQAALWSWATPKAKEHARFEGRHNDQAWVDLVGPVHRFIIRSRGAQKGAAVRRARKDTAFQRFMGRATGGEK